MEVLLINVLASPSCAAELSEEEWDLLIRQARSSRLLPHLAAILKALPCYSTLPKSIKRHFTSSLYEVENHKLNVRWEVRCISEALAELEVKIVLLKGASYVLSGHPAGNNRLFTDIDFMVPESSISEVERYLFMGGWLPTKKNAYDQKYFREWMHEIPPLRHIQRNSVLDVHHSILPLTSRIKFSPEKLFEDAVVLNESAHIYVLNPLDRVLHSATHLFLDGEFDNGLRDLVDIAKLLDGFTDSDMEQLIERAIALGLQSPLYYALRYRQRVLKQGQEIPSSLLARLNPPGAVRRQVMDQLFMRVLRPYHRSCEDGFSAVAKWLLFVRGHYLKMPLKVLIPHLIRKSFRSSTPAE